MAGIGNRFDFGFGVFPYSYVSAADHELSASFRDYAARISRGDYISAARIFPMLEVG